MLLAILISYSWLHPEIIQRAALFLLILCISCYLRFGISYFCFLIKGKRGDLGFDIQAVPKAMASKE